ncbi:MAG: prolipoprotein diacylglyceryl transferase [Proteobacteria bacterium]|nr:prolipoprotein diacylglyceryl transferase [Pseudomonadota bacterium]
MSSQYQIVNIDPVLLDLGLLQIHWYGVTYLIGFGLYWLLGVYRINNYQSNWDKPQLSDFLFYGAMAIIVGGRIGWLLFYNDTSVLDDPLLPFKIWEGGMSFHGGLAGLVVALYYFKMKTGKTFFQVSDFIAPLGITGILSVRLGNFINGELWGRITDVPWAVIFPSSLPYQFSQMSMAELNTAQQSGILDQFARHPSQLYEAFGEGLITFIIVWLVAHYSKKPGTTTAAFLICYGIARFIVEFFREPDSNRGFIAFDWMTMGHILTIPILLLGLVFLFVGKKQT